MSTMVERVARAIFAKSEHWMVLGGDVWETAPEVQRKMCLSQACAAIEAMREQHNASARMTAEEFKEIALKCFGNHPLYKSRGWQKATAEFLGCDVDSIRRWANGYTAIPGPVKAAMQLKEHLDGSQ